MRATLIDAAASLLRVVSGTHSYPPPAYESCISGSEQLDPLVICAQHNKEHCHFLKLPQEVLLRIMTSLKIDSVLRLRHTSRIFMRIFSLENTFKQYHLTAEQNRQRYLEAARIWATPSLSFADQFASSCGDLCEFCAAKRSDDFLGLKMLEKMPFLYCARCNEMHREMHFSASQRLEDNDTERVCLGHEGYFNLCRRFTLSFHQIHALARRSTGEAVTLVCPDRHCPARPTCGGQLCQYSSNPSVKVYRDEKGCLRLEKYLATHISIKRLPSGKISAHHLRKELLAMRPDIRECSWLPELSCSSADVLRVFDPNICSCVEWGLPDETARSLDWPLCSNPNKEWREPCRKNSYTGVRGRCAGARHGFDVHYLGRDIKIDIARCHDREDLLIVEQTLSSVVDSATSVGWLSVIAPVSCQTFQDDGMRGVTWCQEECAVDDQWHLGLSLVEREALQLQKANHKVNLAGSPGIVEEVTDRRAKDDSTSSHWRP